jgi:hypothetical protein
MNSENIKQVKNQAIEHLIVALNEGRSGEGGIIKGQIQKANKTEEVLVFSSTNHRRGK